MPIAELPKRKKKHYADEITKQNVEADYIAGRGSCAQLAKRYGLNTNTIISWCNRGGWKRANDHATQSVEARVEMALNAKAESLAERGARFLERCAEESEGWLDTIRQSKQLISPADVAAVSQLVNAWKVPVAVGRQTYGLDQENQQNRVQIAVYSKDGVTMVESQQSPPAELPEPET
jgi:transposase